MRILHTSDWHLGKTLMGMDRLSEQEAFVEEICLIADDEKIDLVLLAGDIFDTYNPPAAAEELFCEAMDRLSRGGSRAVVVIAGNHDNPERLCAVSPLAVRQGVFLLGTPRDTATQTVTSADFSGKVCCVQAGKGCLEIASPGCRHRAALLTLPYPSEARLKEVISLDLDEALFQKAYSEKVKELLHLGAEAFREDTVNLLVSHIFTMGGKESDSERPIQLGGACTVYPEAFPRQVQYAALGHLHRPQRIVPAPVPIYYAGSPLAYSFSEANQSKAVYIVDVHPGGEPDVKALYINSGKPLVRMTAMGGISEVHRWIEEGKHKDAWVELEVYLKEIMLPQEIAAIKKAHPGIITIKPVFISSDQKQEASLHRSSLPIDELFKQFYKQRSGGALPDEETVRLFLELLNEDAHEGTSDEQGEAAS
ncbi:MAG: exonuclease SbcCD subunit D [Bacillota bacterium]